MYQRAMGVIFEMILAEYGRSSAADPATPLMADPMAFSGSRQPKTPSQRQRPKCLISTWDAQWKGPVNSLRCGASHSNARGTLSQALPCNTG